MIRRRILAQSDRILVYFLLRCQTCRSRLVRRSVRLGDHPRSQTLPRKRRLFSARWRILDLSRRSLFHPLLQRWACRSRIFHWPVQLGNRSCPRLLLKKQRLLSIRGLVFGWQTQNPRWFRTGCLTNQKNSSSVAVWRKCERVRGVVRPRLPILLRQWTLLSIHPQFPARKSKGLIPLQLRSPISLRLSPCPTVQQAHDPHFLSHREERKPLSIHRPVLARQVPRLFQTPAVSAANRECLFPRKFRWERSQDRCPLPVFWWFPDLPPQNRRAAILDERPPRVRRWLSLILSACPESP